MGSAMDLESVKQWIEAGEMASVESAWLDAVLEGAPLEDMLAVLEAMVSAGHAETADELAEALWEERYAGAEPVEALAAARALALAVPGSDGLRARAADLYQQVHGASDRFSAIFEAAGLLSGQSPRRAFRTLDLCLGLPAGAYLANRFDGRVVRAIGFDPAGGLFSLADAAGREHRVEPKLLADEYELIDPQDFRAVCQHRPEQARELLANDPAAVLIGLCLGRGGRIDADDLKGALVGKLLEPGEWSGWWSRARTAARRCPQLVLEGRSPVVVTYHPAGRTLEQELAGAMHSARTAADLHALMQRYLREVKGRKLKIDPAFAGRIVDRLAEQARSAAARRPAEALLAALAVESAVQAGAPEPSEGCPSAAAVLAGSDQPGELLGALDDDGLWGAALSALAAMPGAGGHLERMLRWTAAGRLDALAERLAAAGLADAVHRAAAEALSDPGGHLELYLWLWKGPARAVAGVPGPVELLGRLLKWMGDLARQWDLEPARRKDLFQRVRSALSASDYASFRSAVAGMDEHVAEAVKRQLERLDGLAESVREGTLGTLRERFPRLFFTQEQAEPWEDPNTIWTTQAALDRRQAEYKDLTEVKMLANARAIGAAAAHGDLSENSEWKFALEERDMLQARALKMQEELARARVLDPAEVPTGRVAIGSRVMLRREGDGREVELTFLGPWDADPQRNVYSYQSRAAQDLMGQRPGASVELKTEGAEGTYRIERIESALAG